MTGMCSVNLTWHHDLLRPSHGLAGSRVVLHYYNIIMGRKYIMQHFDCIILLRFRPSYSSEVFKTICSFLDKHKIERNAIVDIGCGSGQSTFQWSSHFKKCIGTDISPAQISCANDRLKEAATLSNVEFRVAQAEKLPMDDGSVDVVTSAQSWHWMDVDKASTEVRRVLKSPGCFVAYGYVRPKLVNRKANAIIDHHYSVTLGPYWHPRRTLVDKKFASLDMPYSVTERLELSEVTAVKLSHFIGYLESWSGYQKYCEVNPGNTVLADLKNELQLCLNCDSDASVDVEMLYFIIFCLSNSTVCE